MSAQTVLSKLGVAIDGPLPMRLEFVRHICRLTEPVISLYRGRDGTKYLEIWVDRGNDWDRRLVFAVSRRQLLSFMAKRETLRNLILNAQGDVVFVRDESPEGERASFLAAQDVPEDLLPADNSYYEPSLDPSPESENADCQVFLLDGKWETEDLAELKRWYSQVYAILHFLRIGQPEPTALDLSKRRFNGGFSFYQSCNEFVNSMSKPPRTLEFQYASSGLLVLSAGRDDALAVKVALKQLDQNLPRLIPAYDRLHGLLLQAKRAEKGRNSQSQVELDKEVSDGTALEPVSAEEFAQALTHFLGLLGSLDERWLRVVGKTAQNAAEIAATYYRRLRDLRKLQQDQVWIV